MFMSYANMHALKLVLAAACFGALTACQSSAPTEEKMARTATETAPADLQTLCASTTATTAKVDSAKVLPISSAKVDDQTYTVDVDAAGKKFTCLVDMNGTVKSVTPMATVQ